MLGLVSNMDIFGYHIYFPGPPKVIFFPDWNKIEFRLLYTVSHSSGLDRLLGRITVTYFVYTRDLSLHIATDDTLFIACERAFQ